MQAATYPAEQTRRTIATLLQRGASIGSIAGGLVSSTDMQVTAGSGMQVLVGTGEAWVPGTSSATQSGYYCRVTSSTALAIAASSESNPRIDTVIAKCVDASYAGSGVTFAVAVLTGTAESGSTLANQKGAAAVPASSMVPAYLLVPAKSSSVSGGTIENVAALCVPGLGAATYLEGTAAARPAAGVKGRIYRATDTGAYSLDTGEAWLHLLPVAAGQVYGALTERYNGTSGSYEGEPSAASSTQVILMLEKQGAEETMDLVVTVGGNALPELSRKAGVSEKMGYPSFIVPAGVKYKATVTAGAGGAKLFSSYLPL
jgi:hypothetical protein